MARYNLKKDEEQIDRDVFIISENSIDLFGKKENIILDTSVLIKWFFNCDQYNDEKNTDTADSILKQYLNNEIGIIVPELALFEITNVLKNKMKLIKDKDILSEIIDRIFSLGIVFYINKEILKNALDIAILINESVYDCIFISTAAYFNSKMITDDKILYNNYLKSKNKLNLKSVTNSGTSKKLSEADANYKKNFGVILLQDYKK
jgi:predicted nucleic acid-binding protein